MAPDRKSNSNSGTMGYVRQLPLSPLPWRPPLLQRLPHHHTPQPRLRPSYSRVRRPARRRRPRKRRKGSASTMAQTWRPPLSQPQARQPSHRLVSFLSNRLQHSRPGSVSPAETPPRFQATSVTVLLTMVADGDGFSQGDPSKGIQAQDAATRAEEDADVNTRHFIDGRRLGGSYDRAAGVGRSVSARMRLGCSPS